MAPAFLQLISKRPYVLQINDQAGLPDLRTTGLPDTEKEVRTKDSLHRMNTLMQLAANNRAISGSDLVLDQLLHDRF